jgi:hypothetical protein
MTTVYVVTQGEYSDKRICAIYSAQALAEHALALIQEQLPDWRAPTACFESWELDAVGTESNLFPYYIIFYDDRVDTAEIFPNMALSNSESISAGYSTIYVQARNAEHAVKIARDRRGQTLAEQAGL